MSSFILSFESIAVELLTEIHGISSLLVAGISIPLAGMILLFISTVLSKNYSIQIMEAVTRSLGIPCCSGVFVV
ncbi:MAG TPA: hypothetical protein VEH06_00975 [Candidatus Bathyarchaeia archaeon]|nr:hypothetical protein [Candidatus Bathyarchaeia archaeon]